MSIRHLPWEIISYIAQDLSLDDIFSLSLSCRQLQGLIHDDNICRRALEALAPSAPETKSARQTREYARELRRLVKRRSALSSASPFLAAIVAVAETFIFCGGVLCYVSDGKLRVLDLHNSAEKEHVVDIVGVLSTDPSIPWWGDWREEHDFQLLHYSHGVVTCRHSLRRSPPGRLVVIDLVRGRVLSHELESAHKLFVRNDADWLYYGTHTEVYDDDERRWALRCCNLREGKWFDFKIPLADMIGSEIGSNICFEIIDGYLYCLANRANFEIEELAWTSYYTYLRFPVGELRQKNLDLATTTPVTMWRRYHREGPIDDRWTFLRLVKDEATGVPTVVESRKEWRSGKSTSLRTYYTSELRWTHRGDSCDPGGSATAGAEAGPSSGSSGGNLSDDADDYATPDRWTGPKSDQPDEPTSRSPESVHPGDDASSLSMFTLANSFIRSYHPTCQTFLDLVNDPASSNEPGTSTQRIRLRAGSRRLRTESEARALRKDTSSNMQGDSLYPESEIKALYKASEPKFWPPDQQPGQQPDPALEDLYEVLSPSGMQGEVCGIWDERSICYATGGADKAIIFISWDPSIRLRGIQPWSRRGGRAADLLPDDQQRGRGEEKDQQLQQEQHGDCRRQTPLDYPPATNDNGVIIPAAGGFPAETTGAEAGLTSSQIWEASAAAATTTTAAKGKRRADAGPLEPRATLFAANACDSSPAAATVDEKGKGGPIAVDSGPFPADAAAGPATAADASTTASDSSTWWSWVESPMYAAIQRGYDFTL